MDLKQWDTDKNLIMRLFTLVAQLAALNLLMVVFCIPIITTGAAFAAMHDCLQQIVRKEDGYITRRFMASFRENLRQGTILFLPFIPVFFGVAIDVLIQFLVPGLFPGWVLVPAGTAGILGFFIFLWVFPVQARFHGTAEEVFRLSLLLFAARFPRTAAMAMMWMIPVLLFRFLPLLPLSILFGFALPGYLNVLFYLPVFGELEEEKTREKKGD